MLETISILGGRDLTGRRLDLTARGIALIDRVPADITIDATGLTVAPGFIDVQVNGAYGHDFTTDPDSMWDAAARLPETGVTAFLPTLITAPDGAIPRSPGSAAPTTGGFPRRRAAWTPPRGSDDLL